MTFKKLLFCIVIILSAQLCANAQTGFTFYNNRTTETAISKDLWGSFFELGFGRSDLLWADLLFNGDFENTKPISESNGWYQSYAGDAKAANWWHTGYQEPKWYINIGGKNSTSLPLVNNNYWPAGHGKYFISLNNQKNNTPAFLLQDSIYLQKGKSYNFSGLLSNGIFFSDEATSEETTEVAVAVFQNGTLINAASKNSFPVNSNQLSMYKCTLPPVAEDGWYSFAVQIPAGRSVGIDKLSLMADDNLHGWKREALERIKKDLRPKTMRMPGGCFASLYNWRSGIGPREKRPVSYDTWWDCELVNDIGTFEMVDLSNAIGADPFFCVPVMFNNEYNAADWVDFCNNPNNALRIAYGRKEPLNVKYWELDNEPYRRYDAITYAERCKAFAIAMKQKDPTIKIAAGNYWIFNKRFKEMLDIFGPYIDLVTNRGGSIKEMQNDLKIIAEYNLKNKRNIRLCHTEFRAPLSRAENNADGLNQSENNSDETLFTRSARWEYAMNMADQYIQFQNMGAAFFTANFTNLADGWGECLINNPKSGNYLSASGVAYSLMTQLDMQYPIEVKKDASDKKDNLVMLAAWNAEENKLTVVILNFDKLQNTVLLNFEKLGQKFAATSKAFKIAPASGNSYNSVLQPNAVKIEQFNQKVKQKFQTVVSPMSLVAFEFIKN